MDLSVAKALLAQARSFDGTIGAMFETVRKIEDDALRAKFGRAVGDLMGAIAHDLIFPIEDRFPELKDGD